MSSLKNLRRVPLKFHMIPYHLQYENRDFKTRNIVSPSLKTIFNRELYIKKFNPYLKTNVSDNLDHSLEIFYQTRYIHRY